MQVMSKPIVGFYTFLMLGAILFASAIMSYLFAMIRQVPFDVWLLITLPYGLSFLAYFVLAAGAIISSLTGKT